MGKAGGRWKYTSEEDARRYIELSTSRSRWVQFLHAIAATHELSSVFEGEILSSLLEKAGSTPEEARRRCPLTPINIPDTYNKNTVTESICRAASQWEKIEDAINRCDSEWVSRNVYGLRLKGADMLMLLSGCNTVVADREMIRMIKPGISESSIKKIQSSRRLYNEVKSELEKMAREEGIPYNVWHVKEWLKRADGPLKEGARKWIEKLFKQQ